MFLLYSIRHQGWLTRSSQYSSDWKEGKQVSYHEALGICSAHNTHQGPGMIPVSLTSMHDLEAL